MQLTNYAAQVWKAVTSLPTPDQVRQKLLRQAQLEHLKALSAAEDHSVHAEAYKEHARMLHSRIERLSKEPAHV